MGVEAAIIASTVVATAGGLATAAMGPEVQQPGTPDYRAATREGYLADIETLPARRRIEALARLGGADWVYIGPEEEEPEKVPWGAEAEYLGPDNKWYTKEEWRQKVNDKEPGFGWIVEGAATIGTQGTGAEPGEFDFTPTVNGASTKSRPRIEDREVADNYRWVDFTGLGDIDYQRQYQTQMTELMLDLNKRYGSEFVSTALELWKQADPQGHAAREELFNRIMEQAGRTRERPIAEELEKQISSELAAGAELDPETRREIEQSILRRQAQTGNLMGNAPAFAQAMEIGSAAEQRRSQRQQKALSYLTSGVSPEDVEYRTAQQNMANLASFMAGQTPQSQFSQVSSAGAGVVPFASASPLPGLNEAAGQQGAAYALNAFNTQTGIWRSQLEAEMNQANPWLAGLGLGLQGFSAFYPLFNKSTATKT